MVTFAKHDFFFVDGEQGPRPGFAAKIRMDIGHMLYINSKLMSFLVFLKLLDTYLIDEIFQLVFGPAPRVFSEEDPHDLNTFVVSSFGHLALREGSVHKVAQTKCQVLKDVTVRKIPKELQHPEHELKKGGRERCH